MSGIKYGPKGCKTSSDPDYQAHRKFCKNHGWTTWEDFDALNPQRQDAEQKAKSKRVGGLRRAANPTCMADVQAIAQLNRDIVAAKLAAKGLTLPPLKPSQRLRFA